MLSTSSVPPSALAGIAPVATVSGARSFGIEGRQKASPAPAKNYLWDGLHVGVGEARLFLIMIWTLFAHITMYKVSRRYREAYQFKYGDDRWAWTDQ